MDINALIESYYKKDTQLYDIYMSHAEDVTNKALSIVRKHPELAVDTRFIKEAAMLHDIGIFMTDAPGIYCEGKHPYICHGYLGRQLLDKIGLHKHALVCERHTGTGLTLERIISQQLPIPHRDMQPRSLEEKIICFADKFYSKTQLGKEKPIEKVRASLQRHDWHQVEIFDTWCEFFL